MGNSVVFPSRKEGPIPSWMESRLFFHNKSGDEEEKLPSDPTMTLSCLSGRKPVQKRIPYLLFKEETEPTKSQYLMIYFHGNSAVLSRSYKTLERYHSLFKISIMSPEYPGYGLYNTESSSEEGILVDAEIMIRYCIDILKYKEENIILMGRSLGTGVVARMGSKFPNLKGLILISPYLSIREVARNKVGSILARMVPDIFRTRDIIEQVKAPILLIHGLKDNLVPSASSSYLYDHCKSSIKMLTFRPTMEHKKMDFQSDCYIPILTFLADKLQMIEFQEQLKKETQDDMSLQNKPGIINLENPKTTLPSKAGKSKADKADPSELE